MPSGKKRILAFASLIAIATFLGFLSLANLTLADEPKVKAAKVGQPTNAFEYTNPQVSSPAASDEDSGGHWLINFGVVGCTFVRDVDKFPLKSLWRIHHQQHLDLLCQWIRCRSCYLVFFVFRSSHATARWGWCAALH